MGITLEDVKQKLESRLAFVLNEIKDTESRLGDPVMYNHNNGYLTGLKGSRGGQQQWLEEMIDFISKGIE